MWGLLRDYEPSDGTFSSTSRYSTWFFFSAPHCWLLKTTATTAMFSRTQVSISFRLMPHAPSPTYATAGREGAPI